MSRFSPGCLCCPTATEPCDNCSSGFAPLQLKLVVPSGTFVNNTTAPSLVFPDGQVLCPDPPGCDFYAGTYLLTLDDCTGMAECCCLSICFDHDNSSGCDCGAEQSDACAAFCLIQACLDHDDEAGYVLDVYFYYGSFIGEPLCGSCDGRSQVDFSGAPIQFARCSERNRPIARRVESAECSLVYTPPNPCTLGMSWCPDCTAVGGAAVYVSSA